MLPKLGKLTLPMRSVWCRGKAPWMVGVPSR